MKTFFTGLSKKQAIAISAIVLAVICFIVAIGIMWDRLDNAVSRKIIEHSTSLILPKDTILTKRQLSFPYLDSTKPSGFAFNPFSAVVEGNHSNYNDLILQIQDKSFYPPRAPDPEDPFDFCLKYNYDIGRDTEIQEIHVYTSRMSIFPEADFVLILLNDDRFKMYIYSANSL